MKRTRKNKSAWVSLLLVSLCPEAHSQSASACSGAPITLDGSTAGRIAGNSTIRISGGELSGDGHNLFHNFSCFNIPDGSSAVFRNPAEGIRNVIARVTGSEPSMIAGDLATQLGADRTGRASVFLLNPNGVLFSGNSSIDVNALVVSTARNIGFSGGANVTLTSSTDDLGNVTGDPINFGDLDATGTLQFDDARFIMTGGGDLLLIAKDIELQNGSQISTQGAQVVVAGTGAGNAVAIDVRNRAQLPSIRQTATGTVRLDEFSSISTSHEDGGRIVIRGGTLTLTNSNPSNAALHVADAGGSPGIGIDLEATQSLTLTRSQISTGTNLEGNSSDIRISAPAILMDKEVAGINESAITTIGRGGDIGIVTTSLTIRDGEISTNVKDGGTGGTMTVKADEVTITDRSSIQSVAETSSNGGDIHVEITGNLHVDGNGATRIDGNGMRILETVGITANTLGSGQGGEILVDVGGDITLRNGALIDSTTFSEGDAGRIRVNAGNLFIDGENFEFATGITAFATDQTNPNAGRGGDIEVNVPGMIEIVNAGEIDTSSFGAGNAGQVSINMGSSKPSENIVIDKGTATRFTGIGSDASGSGSAGEVTVRTKSLSISNGGLISTGVFYEPETDGMGNTIPVDPGTGNGGNVNVFANSIRVSGSSSGVDDGTSIVPNSAIYAGTQAGSAGAGGGISIKPLDSAAGASALSIQLSNGAEIGARTEGSGTGGSVEIRHSGGRVDLDSASSISARAGQQGGDAGSVIVEAGNITLRNNSSISSTNRSDPMTGGDAGSVTLIPRQLRVDRSSLEVSASGGNAGELRVEGGTLLDILNSELVAEAFDNGGNIVISGVKAVLLDQSRISANAVGDGGIIDITSNVFFSQNSLVTAISEQGDDGIVEIDSSVTLTGAEGQLEISALDATDLIQPECTKRLDTEAGSFIRAGRGGSARLPGGYLPSLRLHQVP